MGGGKVTPADVHRVRSPPRVFILLNMRAQGEKVLLPAVHPPLLFSFFSFLFLFFSDFIRSQKEARLL